MKRKVSITEGGKIHSRVILNFLFAHEEEQETLAKALREYVKTSCVGWDGWCKRNLLKPVEEDGDGILGDAHVEKLRNSTRNKRFSKLSQNHTQIQQTSFLWV